jgi:hypothetical protein
MKVYTSQKYLFVVLSPKVSDTLYVALSCNPVGSGNINREKLYTESMSDYVGDLLVVHTKAGLNTTRYAKQYSNDFKD